MISERQLSKHMTTTKHSLTKATEALLFWLLRNLKSGYVKR